MIYLLLSVVFTTSLILIFKYFEKYKIITIQAIVVNYITASSLGLFYNKGAIGIAYISEQPWAMTAMILGVVFIGIFNLIAITTQKLGVSVATVANKMSLVIPVFAAIYLYHDSVNILKILGIIIALAAVYLTSKKQKEDQDPEIKKHPSMLYLPLIVFIGSGCIDTLINYSQVNYLKPDDMDIFISICFASAAFTGIIILLYRFLFLKKRFQFKSIIAGVVLGIPNYFSIYYLLKALDNKTFESSVLFPLNNMGIVALSSVYALLFFKEKLSRSNWVGIILSLFAIALIAFA